MEREIYNICVCILGVISLYLGVASLLSNMGGVFILTLPLNILFVYWYSKRLKLDG